VVPVVGQRNIGVCLWDTMKIIGRFALAAVAAAGLVFATSAQAGAVDSHKHRL
jgi:hypothetical protein